MTDRSPSTPGTRRDLLRGTIAASALAAAAFALFRRSRAASAAALDDAPSTATPVDRPPATPAAARPRRVLLHSGWQFVHVGDLAQTPGGLRLLERYLPDAEVTLWLAHTTKAVTASIRQRFPKVRIVQGTIDPTTLAVTGDELKAALESADLVIHGSDGTPLALPLLNWCQSAKKPYGLLGVTIGDVNDRLRSTLASARFAYARESQTLATLTKAGVAKPAAGQASAGQSAGAGGQTSAPATIGFAPDAAFACDVRDDAAAAAYPSAAKLEPGQFVCVVPKLRHPPFRKLPPEVLKQREAENEKFAEPDHAKLREVVSAVVRQTGMKVLVCPEMTYELEVMDKLVIGPLAADVKAKVVKRDTFWLPAEAAGVYAKAAAVVSLELGPCVLALANGTPAVHLRQPTDPRKGQVLRDLGLSDWIFEVDDASGEQISRTVLAILKEEAAAKAKVSKAKAVVDGKYQEAFAAIGKVLGFERV